MSKSHVQVLHFLLCATAGLLICLMCGCSPRIEQSRVGIGQDGTTYALEQIGHISIYFGGIALLVIGLARAAAYFPATSFLMVFTPLMGEAAALAATAIIIGSCLVWVSLHFWVVYLSVVAVAAVYFIRHYALFRNWLSMVKKDKSST